MQRPNVLATDLDGTLIPLDGSKRNRSDLRVLNAELRTRDLTLVYVTGRHYELAMLAIEEYGLAEPDWLITDVGTGIRTHGPNGLDLVEAYALNLRRIVHDAPRSVVERELCTIDGLQLQEPVKQGEFKVSFYVSAKQLDSAVGQIQQHIRDRCLPWSIVSSIDPFSGGGLIDLLPQRVSKAFALDWFSQHIGVSTARIVYAGDSGNDLAVFAQGYHSIVVGNADPVVAQEVMRTHVRKGWSARLYLAKKEATSGLLAGCRWFGLLPQLRRESDLLGATPIGENRVQFRVWAPNTQAVELSLEAGGDVPVRMSRESDGYHTATLEGIGTNARYSYVLDGSTARPDPASRYQPDGVHGPSQVIDPQAFEWADRDWRGVAKRDLIIYELHIGAFTQAGTFRGAIDRLPELVELGVTAVELMPITQSPGRWNWGYDGVNLFAIRNTYGTPNDFRAFVDACHGCGLAVILDVVYNHVGPEGNYLSEFGPYRSSKHNTPWGDALNFDAFHSEHVRRFVVENAVRWLDEYHLDGLRLDAVHFMFDDSDVTILDEIRMVVSDFADTVARPVHLIAESNVHDADLLAKKDDRPAWDAVWCDCLMHAIYSNARPDLRLTPREYNGFPDIVQALENGFIYTGRDYERRTREHNARLDDRQIGSLIIALQTHDVVGNHPQGKRLHQLTSKEYQKAAAALILLYPAIPMIFMGEESAAEAHFPFFADFEDESLRRDVDSGRRAEYPHHDWSNTVLPSDPRAFQDAKSDSPQHHDSEMRDWYRELLQLRKRGIAEGWLSWDALSVSHSDSRVRLVYATGDTPRLVIDTNLDPAQPFVFKSDMPTS